VNFGIDSEQLLDQPPRLSGFDLDQRLLRLQLENRLALRNRVADLL
jgi:hypothetical protein